MARGGARPGAGRKPGSKAKNVIEEARANLSRIQASTNEYLPELPPELQNLDPMGFMHYAAARAVMAGDEDKAFRYMKEILPYTTPKLANIVVKTEEDIEAVALTMEEIDARLNALARLTAIDAEIIEPDEEAGD